jgi:hypothetical protein
MSPHIITADDLEHALAQRAEIDLVSHGRNRITYNVTDELYRIYRGDIEVDSAVTADYAAELYNELEHKS